MEFSDWISLWKSIEGLPPAVQSGVVVAVSLVIMRLRTLKHAKNSRVEIARAVMIQKAEDKADYEERADLLYRVDEILNVVCGRLYSAMEKFTYQHPDTGERWIDIIRDKNVIQMPANNYLVLHHSKSKKVIFNHVMPFIMRQLESHNVSTDTVETKTSDTICEEIREMLLSGIHKLAGSNEEAKEIELDIITEECIISTWSEVSNECVLIKLKRDQKVRDLISVVKV